MEFSITVRVRTKRSDSFCFLSFSAFSILLWLEMKPYRNFLFFEFFCYRFGIFYYESGNDETKRYFLFSLFLSLFHPILTWNEAVKEFFNFLNFFAIFLEFSITRRVRTKRNRIFYFLSFSAISNLFWLEMNPQRWFLIFWIFLLFFWSFLLRIG